MSVLVIAAHPDDEVLGCGGTISKYAQKGEAVYTAILGQGISSRFDTPQQASKKEIDALHKQSRNAASVLGVKDLFMYDLPDNRFDTVALLDIIKPVEKLIERLKPHTIFTHHTGDLNIDHQLVHRAVLTATRPMADCPVKSIYAFEVPSATEWSFDQFNGFAPNYFVDISSFVDKKVEAMAQYSGELRSFPHPRSEKYIRHLAALRGGSVGKDCCEAFMLVRQID